MGPRLIRTYASSLVATGIGALDEKLGGVEPGTLIGVCGHDNDITARLVLRVAHGMLRTPGRMALGALRTGQKRAAAYLNPEGDRIATRFEVEEWKSILGRTGDFARTTDLRFVVIDHVEKVPEAAAAALLIQARTHRLIVIIGVTAHGKDAILPATLGSLGTHARFGMQVLETSPMFGSRVVLSKGPGDRSEFQVSDL